MTRHIIPVLVLAAGLAAPALAGAGGIEAVNERHHSPGMADLAAAKTSLRPGAPSGMSGARSGPASGDGRFVQSAASRFGDPRAIAGLDATAGATVRLAEAVGAASDASPAPAGVQDVAEGTPERAALLDAARAVIAPEIGQPIAFRVGTLRRDGPWAYLSAVPVQPGGQPLDWLHTRFAEAWRGDMMSDIVMVLFHDDGSGWRVFDRVIGPTDVYWFGWMQDHDLPESLFLPVDQ
ncbi:hypothetical protein [Maritimibacter sp. HL-12]|uniref:hypothetical protein n=1 Tax=Maritimibacter sp. HL-12 TaxID=1162418 RepID=UPI000A0F2DF6|nr:hypothetical protein [Maritimibacter sp. HL-12]SMH30907.1 hypothetical protein SAMN05661107_0205 [Maritimibacter sp. HL-12]